jgi:hypothetical protein
MTPSLAETGSRLIVARTGLPIPQIHGLSTLLRIMGIVGNRMRNRIADRGSSVAREAKGELRVVQQVLTGPVFWLLTP